MERPYIGVTGAATVQETRHLVKAFEENGLSSGTSHLPMAGFLVSFKTLNGLQVLNRRYPPFGSLISLLEATEGYPFNTIHYNTSQTSDLKDQILRIFAGPVYQQGLCRGLQLNITWPPVSEIESIKGSLPDLKVIMQLSKKSMRGFDEEMLEPEQLAEKLIPYSQFIDYVLIDPSGGRGQPFYDTDILPYYFTLRQQFPGLSVGFAGGFTGVNVAKRCGMIIGQIGTENFSIDAEGGLRDKLTSRYGDDLYNPYKVENYIKGATRVFLKKA